jgi:hypothetical protein
VFDSTVSSAGVIKGYTASAEIIIYMMKIMTLTIVLFNDAVSSSDHKI